MKRERATVAAWVIGPPAVAILLVVVGDLGTLGWPPPPTRWIEWSTTTDPAFALAAIVRAVALGACGLTSVRVGYAIVQALIGDPSISPLRPVAPGSLRRALGRLARPTAVAGLGVGLASSTVMSAGAAVVPASPVATASVPTVPASPNGDDGHPGGSLSVHPSSGSSYAEMRRVHIVLAPLADAPLIDAPTMPDAADVWVVERGDHLWSIAHETLTEHLGTTPSDRRIARYWRRLIDANRERLVIPDDPDVILPGQRLVLPRPASGRDQRSGT